MNLANGPLVVIPEPIRAMGWTYDVERSILEPLGIRLLVPDSAEEAREALPDADVVFTSSRLTAEDIAHMVASGPRLRYEATSGVDAPANS